VKRRGCNSTLTKPKSCETTQARNARRRPRKTDGRTVWPAPFHILSRYPDHINPTERPHHYPGYVSTLLQEVKQFDYLSLRLDPMVNMKAAVSSIQEKANKAHSLVLAVSYSLRYYKHHSNPTICSSPVELLNLWKSCVLPHFLLYLCYISYETQVKTLQASLNKSLSTTMHVYGHPKRYLLTQGFPLCTSRRICNLHNLDSGYTPPPPPPSSIFSGAYGSHCYKQCLSIQLKTACRML